MSITESTTRVADAQALWTHQLQGKTVIDALTSLFATESQALETVAQDALLARTVDGATGGQLDELGLLVGQLREGRDDDRYRVWIKARIRANRSSGSPVDMYAVANLIIGADKNPHLYQVPIGHHLTAGYSAANVYDVQRILQQTSSAGVPFAYWYAPNVTNDSVFTFASGSAVVTGNALGFDNGRLRGAVGSGSVEVDALGSTYSGDIVERVYIGDIASAGAVSALNGEYLLELSAGSGDEPAATLVASRDRYTEIDFPSASTDRLDSQALTGTEAFAQAFEGEFTVAWVGAWNGTAGGTLFEIDSGGTDTVSVYMSGSPEIVLSVRGASTTEVYARHTPDTNQHVYVVGLEGTAAGQGYFMVDGALLTSSGMGTLPVPAFGASSFTLGSETASDAPWGTLTGEFIVFNRLLSETEMLDVTAYLERTYTDVYT